MLNNKHILQGRSQHFQLGGSKFTKCLLNTARHKLGRQLATLYNECHLVYDYSHYIVKFTWLNAAATITML